MEQENIILIGTIHNDQKGKQRLEKLLNHTKPGILTIESSDARLEFLQQAKDETYSILKQKGLDHTLIEKLIPIVGLSGYEIDVCEKYAKDHKIPLHPVDLPRISQFEQKNNQIVFANLKTVPNEKLEKAIGKWNMGKWNAKVWDYLVYNQFIMRGKNNLVALAEQNLIGGGRDAYMHKQLIEISQKNSNSKIVHVGGAQHIVMDKWYSQNGTLRTLLPKSKVYFLPEADKI